MRLRRKGGPTSRNSCRRWKPNALEGLDLVVAQLQRVMEALCATRTSSSPHSSMADDDRIDGRYLEVHQGILSLLARQAPVAADLRLVAALLDVIKHIERMGYQCVNIAKLIPLSGSEPPGRSARSSTRLRRWGAQRALAGRRR